MKTPRQGRGGKKGGERMTQKEKMISLMDDLLSVVHRISNNKEATPEEIAALPALADSIVHITGYAVIESTGTISPSVLRSRTPACAAESKTSL